MRSIVVTVGIHKYSQSNKKILVSKHRAYKTKSEKIFNSVSKSYNSNKFSFLSKKFQRRSYLPSWFLSLAYQTAKPSPNRFFPLPCTLKCTCNSQFFTIKGWKISQINILLLWVSLLNTSWMQKICSNAK